MSVIYFQLIWVEFNRTHRVRLQNYNNVYAVFCEAKSLMKYLRSLIINYDSYSECAGQSDISNIIIWQILAFDLWLIITFNVFQIWSEIHPHRSISAFWFSVLDVIKKERNEMAFALRCANRHLHDLLKYFQDIKDIFFISGKWSMPLRDLHVTEYLIPLCCSWLFMHIM